MLMQQLQQELMPLLLSHARFGLSDLKETQTQPVKSPDPEFDTVYYTADRLRTQEEALGGKAEEPSMVSEQLPKNKVNFLQLFWQEL
ncbi:hypothetical protein Y1Q_0004001 [Alligator mississippiensis]|uniref:Uncharacterized protein n=1 Tax=Alligator mississippiensis TaxID=8496 RepID=A0A151PHS7_ALLMI|nr:hypothetical protein Y1Q_0004001 [Alligator mississippiensis]